MASDRENKHKVSDDKLKEVLKPYSYCGDQTDCLKMRKEVGNFLLKAMEGYYISHSQENIIKSLNLLRADGTTPNKRGIKFLHDAYYESL